MNALERAFAAGGQCAVQVEELQAVVDDLRAQLAAAQAGWAASEADCAQARYDLHAVLAAYRDLIATMEG